MTMHLHPEGGEVSERSGARDEGRRLRSRELRLALGAAAIVSVAEAASWLPFQDAEARAWLRELGFVRQIRTPSGRTIQVVRWGDVYEALSNEAERLVPLPTHHRGDEGASRARRPRRP